MSTQANLVLADGQSTPVNHTFSARGADLNLAVWKDISGGIGLGVPSITLSYKETDGTNGAWRCEARFVLPVMEVISGSDGGYTPVPKVAYKMFGKMEFIAPSRSTVQNRKDLKAYMANFLAATVASETLVDFNPPN